MIVKKKKICLGCGKDSYIFSHGKCKNCQPKKLISKQTPRAKERAIEKKAWLEEIHIWEKSLWDRMKLPRRCQSCAKEVRGDFSPLYWDHLKEKSSFPELAMLEWNILFVCGECHSLRNNGFPTGRHKIAIEEAEKIYQNGQK